MTEKTFRFSLEGETSLRLHYRRVQETDRAAWLEFCRFPDSLKYIFSPNDIKSPEENLEVWFERINHRYTNNLGGMNALIEKSSNAFAGQCGLLVQTVDEIEELEIGYSLMPAFRGKGFATEAAQKCRDYAFENNFSPSLISIVHIDNVASQRTALANGMQHNKQTLHKGDPVIIFRITREAWEKLRQAGHSGNIE
ncbi:MAG: GNAT family N-acetyltransferase [Bacteroidia bacterium]|jgi:RimJ/RimL family protein N-acetyltransferase|nr:GNAT family N-acetyltransferase [Bacteroidia bacterium]